MSAPLGVEETDPAQPLLSAMGTAHRGPRRGVDGRLGLWAAAPPALQNRSGARDVSMTAVVGEDAVMADANQPRGENVPAKALDEVAGAEHQGFDFRAVAVIAVSDREQGVQLVLQPASALGGQAAGTMPISMQWVANE